MFAKYFYIQVRKNRISVLDLNSAPPVIYEESSSFSHERMLLGNFGVAVECLRRLITKARGSMLWAPFTRVLIHPAEDLAGGLAPIEERAFMELAEQAYAAKVVVWNGSPLTAEEALEKLKSMG